jgi:hypothetical protein
MGSCCSSLARRLPTLQSLRAWQRRWTRKAKLPSWSIAMAARRLTPAAGCISFLLGVWLMLC